MKITLKTYKNKIIAPNYCPYKQQEVDVNHEFTKNGDKEWVDYSNTDIFTVSPSLCPLCKLCEFVPDTFNKNLELKTEDFVKYLTLLNDQISRSIGGQIFYLQKENRLPITILISPETFDLMLKLTYRDDTDQYNLAYSYFVNNETPICYIAGCPVYLSRKLTKSSVQVVGEIEWH